MNEKEICTLLEKLPLFCGITKGKLAELPLEVSLSAGEEYEVKNSLAVIAVGKADIFKKSLYLKTVTAPSVFGLATLFDKNDGYISTLKAKSETTILLFSEAFVEKLIEESPEFSKRLILLLGEKIRYLNRRIDFYTSPTAEGKLYEYLHTSAKEGYVEVSMSKLSEILDIGRASLYRALSSLEEKGEIKKQGKKIFLLKRG